MRRNLRNRMLGALALALIGTAALSQEVVTKQYDDGSVYEGTFRNGRQDGTGTYTLPNGYSYSGTWVDGEILGQGVARYPNGSVYEGLFEKGKPVGHGKITFPDGGTYGRRLIDLTLTTMHVARPPKLLPLTDSSDHRAYVETLKWSRP